MNEYSPQFSINKFHSHSRYMCTHHDVDFLNNFNFLKMWTLSHSRITCLRSLQSVHRN